METFAENWLANNRYNSDDMDWNEYVEGFEDAMRAQYGERNISDISIGEYTDDNDNLSDIADCMLRFAMHHKVLDYSVFYSDLTESTWVIIKFAKTLE